MNVYVCQDVVMKEVSFRVLSREFYLCILYLFMLEEFSLLGDDNNAL